MASQTFKFPGFQEREIDLTQEVQAPLGTPAGVIGMSERGPAFVPKSVGSFPDFKSKFGDVNPKFVATYAVQKHLENRSALTFVRVLGAGANTTSTHIDTTRTQGTVNNAGFKVEPPAANAKRGAVQYIVARHIVTGSEAFGQAGFTNNNSLFTSGAADEAMLVRGMIFTDSTTRIQVLNHNEYYGLTIDDACTANSSSKEFKIVISSSATTNTVDGFAGIKVLTASLDPTSDNYFAKILNRDPERFSTEHHLVYADYAVDAEVATVGTGSGDIVIASGSANVSANSGDTALPFLKAFGRFDTRYQAPKTPFIISQPFGTVEHDLFQIESIDDGIFANTKYKISIANLQRSSNPRYKYGTFSLLVRAYDDLDVDQQILEQFNNLSLDPESDSYICNVIGDKKVYYNFDAEDESDRRLIVTGKYPNKSKYIRVLPTEALEKAMVPQEALPFGFRGLEVPNYNPRLVDRSGSVGEFSGTQRLTANLGASGANTEILAGLVPPVPFRFKVTRGAVSTDAGKLEGAPGNLETVDSRYYWGVKTERNNSVLNQNTTSEKNSFVDSVVKFLGIAKLDVMVTGSSKDQINNNKFSLARVAFGNGSLADLTSSAAIHMKEAAYIRNGSPDVTDYKVVDANATQRVTFASLLNKSSNAATFNAYTQYAKFTTIMQGGFDGLNILDKNAAQMNDRSTSTESRVDSVLGTIYGNVNGSFTSPGFAINQNGTGITNGTVASYRYAANIITDPFVSNVNTISIPGQREPLVTDYMADKAKEFGLALYVMDIPNYNSSNDRIWDGDVGVYSDPNKTSVTFEGRTLDNDSAAVYYPDIIMDDKTNQKRVTVPGSIAAVSALSYTDKVAYPWWAPAGFNRASLDFVTNTTTRINQAEREKLYASKINPIVRFPHEGFVIMSQNTLELAGSALGSVNVQRMLFDLKKQIIDIGNRIIWEQITPSLKAEIKTKYTSVLATMQAKQGINGFTIICDNTNNTTADEDANKINVSIRVIPTRSVEYISIDFIITKTGVVVG
jgi:hypothetical protein